MHYYCQDANVSSFIGPYACQMQFRLNNDGFIDTMKNKNTTLSEQFQNPIEKS
jgi:hypothetical protein